MRTRYLLLLLAATTTPARAQEFDCRATSSLPASVRPFVERGSCAIALERADLNRDGSTDYLLVLERQKGAAHPDTEGRLRSLVVLAASPDGLRVAARNETVVLCSRCGGVWGDPLEGIEARAGGFTISHYAGSAWRWRLDFTFAYSRRDRAWQLVRIYEVSYHTGDPDGTMKTRVSRPPRDFGKVDLRTFNANQWMERER
jgi:hypothetical protein